MDIRQQSPEVFLDINIIIYYAKEIKYIMIKKQAEILRRRIAHIILIIKSMRRLFSFFLNKYFTFVRNELLFIAILFFTNLFLLIFFSYLVATMRRCATQRQRYPQEELL